MLCPLAAWKPVANAGGPTAPLLGLVVHVQEGNGSLQGWFNNPANSVSSHFWVSKAGTCLVPGHKVLTADLRWTPLGNLRIGDSLVGFDESASGRKRQYRSSVVEAVIWANEPTFGVVLDDEQVIYTTAEHRWLAQRDESWTWQMTMTESGKSLAGARVPKVIEPWDEPATYEAGWFAGLLDGEGTLTNHHRIGFSQRPTAVLDRALAYMDKHNIAYSIRPVNGGDCQYIDIGHGGLAARLAVLGEHRPIRLLAKVDVEKFGTMMHRDFVDARRVVAVYPAGYREIVKVATSTRTFIAEGFPMHNCEQYVDTARQAWAQAAGNAQYLSVETEGYDTEPLTAAQVSKLVELWDWVRTTYLLPNQTTDHGGRGLTTHAHYPSGIPDPAWGNHPCPGALRAASLPTIVTGQPAPPQEVPDVGVHLLAPTTPNDPTIVIMDGTPMRIEAASVAQYTTGGKADSVVSADHTMIQDAVRSIPNPGANT